MNIWFWKISKYYLHANYAQVNMVNNGGFNFNKDLTITPLK